MTTKVNREIRKLTKIKQYNDSTAYTICLPLQMVKAVKMWKCNNVNVSVKDGGIFIKKIS